MRLIAVLCLMSVSSVLWAQTDEARENYSKGFYKSADGKHTEAIESYNKAIELYPEYAKAYLKRAVSHVAIGQIDIALMDFEKAYQLDSTLDNALYQIAVIKILQKDRAAADEYLTRYIEKDPLFPFAYYNRGMARYKMGRTKEAEADLVKALELGYEDAGNCWLELAAIRLELGEVDSAIAAFTVAIEKDSTCDFCYKQRSEAYLEKGMPAEAVADLDKVVALEGGRKDVYFDRSVAYAQMEEYDLALADLNRVLQYDPQDLDAYHNRGAIYLKTMYFEEAMLDYSYVISQREDAAAYYNRGYARFYLNDVDGACADWNKAVELGLEKAKQLTTDYCFEE